MKANSTQHPLRDVVPVEARNDEIGLLLGLLEIGTQNLRRDLGEVDEDALIWQPYPNGHSIGAILIHVAACETGWLHLVAAGQETPMDIEEQLMGGPSIDQYGGIWPAPPRQPLSWYYGQHDEIRTRTVALVRELPDPDEVRTVVWSPSRTCTVRWILHHVIEHEAYHLGQAILLSLMKERIGSMPGEHHTPGYQRPVRQRLLYLHAASPNIRSRVVAAALHEPVPDAVTQIDPLAPAIPYQSVFAAILDDWRVIHFPDQRAPFDDREIDIVGYEFILEKLESDENE